MTALRPTLKTVLLALALASAGTSVWADRNDNRREQRERAAEFSTPPRIQHPRSDGGSSFRSVDSSNDWRNRTEFNRPQQQRYERNSSADFGDRGSLYRRSYDRVSDDSERRNDAINQRLYDDRRNDSGYHRGGQRPVNDVIREVQNRYGGQVIGVQNSEGGSMYRVRVLQRDGRVKNVLVPAE